MSIKVGLESSYPLGGIISYSGFYCRDFINPKPVTLKTPILTLHGDKDDLIPYEHAKKTYEMLNRDYDLMVDPDLG